MMLCECGCGESAPIAKRTRKERGVMRGQPMKFIHGHNSRGSTNPAWNGGRVITRYGYVNILLPGHPRANANGYVPEHIVIAERALGKFLPLLAQVHHINEKRSENLNSNLVICQNQAYHSLLHQRMRAIRACGNPNARKCKICKCWEVPNEKWDQEESRHKCCHAQYERQRYERKAA